MSDLPKITDTQPTPHKMPNGAVEWKLNGFLHREDGPAIEQPNGEKVWCLHGRIHRADGPAVERPNGDKMWYLNGEKHRVDGPAVIHANKREEWWLCGEELKKSEHPYNVKEKLLRTMKKKNRKYAAQAAQVNSKAPSI